MVEMGRLRRRRELFGLLAEFSTPEAVIEAGKQARAAGYERMDAFSPYPVEGLAEAIGYRSSGRLTTTVLIGGIAGAAGGFLLQYWVAAIEYPLNIGGRPLNSWVAFVPVTFEVAVLLAALAAVLGMLAWNGLPMPYHPVFNVERFALATSDRFFLGIGSNDARFDPNDTRAFLEGLDGVVGVYEVEY